MNRFEEQKGLLQFDNTHEGIQSFLCWLPTLKKRPTHIFIGIEGGGNARHALLFALLSSRYEQVYEVNPVFTKQQRSHGTKSDKSDPFDARLIAEIVTRKRDQLPLITLHELSDWMLCLRKTVWFYEEIAAEGTRYKNQIHKLQREYKLSKSEAEKAVLLQVLQNREQRLAEAKAVKAEQIKILQKLLEKRGDHATTLPGLGITTIARIIVHANGIERFSTRDKFIKYAGIAPKERSSGTKKKFLGNEMGKRNLNGVFYYAALNQIIHNEKSRAYYQKKISQGKTKSQSLIALMKVLASMVYSMLKTGEDYRG